VSDAALLKRSTVILQQCLQLKPDEHFLVLYDETVEISLPKALSAASALLGSVAQSMCYLPHRWLYEREFSKFGGAWRYEETLPRVVLGAMKAADCVVFVNSDMDCFFSPGLKALLKEGVRMLLLPYLINRERFLRLLPETPEEILELKETTEKYFRLMDEAGHARMTSPAGTCLDVDLGNHHTGCSKGVLGTGTGGFVGGMELLPAGQVFRVPNKGSAQGKVVLNRSLMAHEYAKLHEPIELIIKDGYIVDIQGGNEAIRLKDFLAKLKDPEIYNVTELGIGTNPRCRFAGLVAPAEDTHTWGQATIAFGNDTHLGGNTRAPCHIDSTMWFPTLELDGKVVVEKGKLN
jgi:2,5-dihydroxypyridine 5,6-dioxygenase